VLISPAPPACRAFCGPAVSPAADRSNPSVIMSAGSHAGAAAPSRPLGGSEAAPCATLGPSQGGRSSLDRGRRRAVAQAAENAFTDAVMAGSAPLQQELFAEIMACLPASDRSTPQRQGGFWYYSYRRAGGAYRVHCRCARGPAIGPPSWLEPAPAGSRARAILSIAAFARRPPVWVPPACTCARPLPPCMCAPACSAPCACMRDVRPCGVNAWVPHSAAATHCDFGVVSRVLLGAI